jgi:hypothetical protein
MGKLLHLGVRGEPGHTEGIPARRGITKSEQPRNTARSATSIGNFNYGVNGLWPRGLSQSVLSAGANMFKFATQGHLNQPDEQQRSSKEYSISKMVTETFTNRAVKNILGILAALAVCLLFAGCGLTSDSRLETVFRKNQPDFDRLVAMSQQDTGFRVIASSFTHAYSPDGAALSQDRWNEYRRLFSKLGISGGLAHSDSLKAAVFFLADGRGLFVTNGLYKGYAYCETPPFPMVNSVDAMPRNLYDKNGHAIAFKALGGNWYLYREEY